MVEKVFQQSKSDENTETSRGLAAERKVRDRRRVGRKQKKLYLCAAHYSEVLFFYAKKERD